MLEAAVQAGYPANPDLNGETQDGVGRFQLTQRGGTALQCRRRLPASGGATARTSRSGSAPSSSASSSRASRAVGVEVVREGSRETIRAEREVILAAGAYQSPVLLMLSGIGLAEELEPFGIAVRQELPVGRNLQDHLMVNVNYLSAVPALFGIFTPENFGLLHERGPRPAHLEPARGRWLLPHAGRPGRARRRVPLLAVALLRRGPHGAARPRLRLRPGGDQARRRAAR